MLNWINNNEPLWLFIILAAELIVGLATLTILIIEYYYDRDIEESKKQKRKKSKRVKIVIDSDGNATIAEAPKELDVSIDHTGQK